MLYSHIGQLKCSWGVKSGIPSGPAPVLTRFEVLNEKVQN